jgi:putative mycofactocin binding protein MftB
MCYRLSPGVRARRERFGLLFYNSRDTKLTFVKSGEFFDVAPDSECDFRLTVCRDNSEGEGKIKRLLEALLKKGLIVETRISV